jgi:hypothetical protein
MNNSLKSVTQLSRSLLAMAIGGAMLLPSTVMAANDGSQDMVQKQIVVRTKQDNADGEGDSDKKFDVSMKIGKKQYQVNEPIDFTVKGNQAFYLYVFTINKDTGKSVLLLPNAKTKDNRLKANKTYKIPNSVEFVGDKPGKEQVIMVASASKVSNVDSLKGKVVGEFKEVQTKSLVNEFNSKSIVIRDKAEVEDDHDEQSADGWVVSRFAVNIVRGK